MKKSAIILSGNLVQDHEFIYPFYRLLEEGFSVEVCLNEGKPVKGILGTDIPPNKNHEVKDIKSVEIDKIKVKRKEELITIYKPIYN